MQCLSAFSDLFHSHGLVKGDGSAMPLPPEQLFAVQFAQTLAHNDYSTAYQMTTQQYQQQTSLAQMRMYFEHIIPTDWGPIDPIEAVGNTLTDFPAQGATDIGWVYVSLEGTVSLQRRIVHSRDAGTWGIASRECRLWATISNVGIKASGPTRCSSGRL